MQLVLVLSISFASLSLGKRQKPKMEQEQEQEQEHGQTKGEQEQEERHTKGVSQLKIKWMVDDGNSTNQTQFIPFCSEKGLSWVSQTDPLKPDDLCLQDRYKACNKFKAH